MIELTEYDYWDNEYAAAEAIAEEGHGIGSLKSEATFFQGDTGYFCVHRVVIDGMHRDAIVFVTTRNTIEVVTAFPSEKNSYLKRVRPSRYLDTK